MKNCSICGKNGVKFFHKINKYIYYKCNNCGTCILQPRPNEPQITSYYANDFKYDINQQQKDILCKRSKEIIYNLKKINPNGRSLLDIGSGYGFLLYEAKKAQIKTLGIEPSRRLYSFSKSKLKLQVQNLSFEEYIKKNQNKKFDYITLVHTIEHFNKPLNVIQMAFRMLNKKGVLFIETPNLNSYLFYFEKRDYTFLTPPEHIWIFSLRSFKYLTLGLKNMLIAKISTYSFSEHLMGIIKILLKRRNKNINKPYQTNSIKIKQKNKSIKYSILDKIIAPLLTPCLNFLHKGSFLEIYIRKE